MQGQRRTEQGFTVVELMIAIIVLSIIVVAYLPMFTNSIASIYTAGHRSEARFQAQQIVERVLGDLNEEPSFSSVEVEDFLLDFADRGIPVEVSAREIDVPVEYTTARGDTRSVNIWTLVLE